MAEPTTAPLEADTFDDADSGISAGTESTETTSIAASVMNYRKENGRTYHSYMDGKYMTPNDDRELDRLDLQHHLFLLTFGGKLCCAPTGASSAKGKGKETEGKKVHYALDVGTGTGIWAIDFADEHPETEVIGIDLSPTQPSMVPPNVKFQIDDVEQEWTFSQKFDFIYSRMMTSSFADWPRFFDQCFKNLNPGGYLECADLLLPCISDDGTLKPDSALQKYCDLVIEATEKIGRPITSAKHYKQQMEKAGFVDVVEKRFVWPLNTWPKDARLKELGMWNHENTVPNVDGFCMALYTRILGWTKEEVEVFSAKVRMDMKNRNIHSYFPIYVVYGRKPE